MRVDFRVLGDVQVARELLRIGDRAGDISPVLNSLADTIVDWTQLQFASEGRRASGGWAQLAPSTVKRRGSAHPILQAHGDLMRAMTDAGNWIITDSWMHLQLPDEEERIGEFHMSGTRRMPRRRPLEFTTADRAEITRRIQRYTMTGLL